MKRVTFLFVLFFLLHYSNLLRSQEISFYYDEIVDNLSSDANSGQLIENLTRQIWSETLSGWENDSLYEHSYNGNNLVDTIIAHKWRNGYIWGNDLRTRYIYNSNNNLIQKYFGEWYTTYWLDRYRFDYTYSNGNLQLINRHYYSPPDWYHDMIVTYTWNANNCVTNIVYQFHSYTIPNYWFYTWMHNFYYDSSNKVIIHTGLYHSDGIWTYKFNDLYFYDVYGNNIELVEQLWNSTDSTWINDYHYLYEYDINNVLLSIVYQDWQQDSLNWKNAWRETYTYTPQNNIATMFKETWTAETGWNNYVFRTYFYDINYNWTEKLTQLWDGTIWKNYYRHLATWLEPVSVEEEQLISNSYYLFNNYPNPFNPVTKIKFTIPSVETTRRVVFTTLVVYDILGREIATLVNEEKPAGDYEVQFNGKGLSSGMYFYTLKAGNYSDTKKMILLR